MFDLKEKKNLRVFSYGLPVILSIFVLLHARKHGWMVSSYVLLAAAFISVLITTLLPTWLKPLYERWMRAARFISFLVTAVCLSFLFYCIFAPIGILLRLFKKDFLDRCFDKTAASYWSKCEHPITDRKHYTQQF